MPFQPRYEPGRFADCPWCQGRGCCACDDEADKAFRRAFPDGVKPLATYNTDDPEDMARCKEVFGAESLRHAFGEGGGGMEEILGKLANQKADHATRP